MKKVIILQHNGGRLANQLWLFISVYAYCLEKGYQCCNYSFFEYGRYFNISPGSFFINFLFFKPYAFLDRSIPSLRRYFRYVIRRLYSFFVVLSIKKFAHDVLKDADANGDPSFVRLPPSKTSNKKIIDFDSRHAPGSLFMIGWLFRNPDGISKFRNGIAEYFRPKNELIVPLEEKMKEVRMGYKKVIGVHIRRGDYARSFPEAVFSDAEVSSILRRYVQESKLDPTGIIFLIFSDGIIDTSSFSGLNISLVCNKEDVQDLFQLSMCDAIIGSDSTFGAFASYYGNIPFIIFQKGDMDWKYYEGRDGYFENKYSTTVKW